MASGAHPYLANLYAKDAFFGRGQGEDVDERQSAGESEGEEKGMGAVEAVT